MDAIFLDIDGVLATPLSDRLNALLRRTPFDQLFDPRCALAAAAAGAPHRGGGGAVLHLAGRAVHPGMPPFDR